MHTLPVFASPRVVSILHHHHVAKLALLLNLPKRGVIAETAAQIDRKHKGLNVLESSSKPLCPTR